MTLRQQVYIKAPVLVVEWLYTNRHQLNLSISNPKKQLKQQIIDALTNPNLYKPVLNKGFAYHNIDQTIDVQ